MSSNGAHGNGQRRVRVLWLIKGLSPGGAERLLALMARARNRDRFDYEAAYLLPWKDGLVSALEHAGVPVECLRGGRNGDLRWAGRLRRRLAARPVDVLHVHSPYVAGIARLVVRSLPPDCRPRVISTEHLPWSGYVLPTRLLNGTTYLLDDAHIAVSRAVKYSIPRPLRRTTTVIRHGIDLEAIRAHEGRRDEARAALGIGPEELAVGTVANLRPQKGYPELLRAARRVLDDGLPVVFVAVGRGPQEAELRRLHQALGLGDRFRFLGFRDDVGEVLAALDLFVLASHDEGLPLALMEAMTLGIPTVASAVGGIPEEMTDGVEGLLVPPRRPDRLADAIGLMLRNPERRARMAQAARTGSAAFDITLATRRAEALFASVAGRPS